MRHPVIVVGAGLAGLTVAARLARSGVRVTVMEGRRVPGGRARTTDRAGYRLNLGPHALAMGGPGTAVLEELGIDLPGRAPSIGGTRFLLDGKLVHPLARRAGGAGARLLPALVRLSRAARGDEPDGSIADLLDRVSFDPRTRGVLDAIVRLSSYADAFSDQAADVLTEVVRGGFVRYLDGGWGALANRLEEAVRSAGGQLRNGARVSRVVTHDEGRVVGVRLDDGTRLAACAVVLATGGPRDAAALLDGQAHATVRDWAARAVPVGLASLDVALRRRPDVPPIVLGIDSPTYLSVHSDRSELAPEGGAVVHLARFLPLGEPAPEHAREELEGALDHLDPSWRQQVVHVRYLPDMVLTHDGGHLASGGRRGRPGPSVPGATGLFVAGDWVGTRGHLAQASLASAAAAADLAAAHAYAQTHAPVREGITTDADR